MHLVHLFIGLFICSFSSLTLFRCHTQCSNWFESKHPIYYGNTVGKKQWLMCTGNGQWPIVTLSHNMNVQWMQTINDRRPLLQWSFHKEWNVYILSVCMYIVPLRTIVDSDHCNCNHCQVHLWKPIDAWTCMYIFTTYYIYMQLMFNESVCHRRLFVARNQLMNETTTHTNNTRHIFRLEHCIRIKICCRQF